MEVPRVRRYYLKDSTFLFPASVLASVVFAGASRYPVPVPTDYLQIWLRADTGAQAAEDGITVQFWPDQSPYRCDALPASGGEPLLTQSALGLSPALQLEPVWQLTEVAVQEPNQDDLDIGKRHHPSGREAAWSDLFELLVYNQVEEYLLAIYTE